MADKNVNPLNIVTWGSVEDFIAVAPLGSADDLTITEIPTEAPAPFEELGALSQEGPTVTPTDEITDLKIYQGGATAKTVMTSSETTFHFQAYESTDLTKGLYWAPKSQSTTGEITERVMGSRNIVKRAWMLGRFEDDKAELDIIPHGEITERAEIGYSRENGTLYDFTVKIIGDWRQLENYTSGESGN